MKERDKRIYVYNNIEERAVSARQSQTQPFNCIIHGTEAETG